MIVELALLVLAGLAAGYVNSIAGAGSLLTLPALVFSGLDAGAANATNRIAVLFQNIAAIVVFRGAGIGRAGRIGGLLAMPAIVSAGLGAYVATRLSDAQLRLCIAVAMIVFLGLSLVPRQRRDTGEAGSAEQEGEADATGGARPATRRTRDGATPRPTWKMAAGIAAIGFYAGFLQAGVGILILLYLSLVHRVDLVVGNSMKVVIMVVLAAASIGMFVWQGTYIDPVRGLVLAAATTVGGYLGAHATVARGERFVRVVLVLAVAASALKLVWDVVV